MLIGTSPWMAPLFGVVTSQNRPWACAFLFGQGEVTTMQIQIIPTEQAKQLIEDLRMHHIDAELIIKEELDQTLPSFIEDLLRGIYEEVVK